MQFLQRFSSNCRKANAKVTIVPFLFLGQYNVSVVFRKTREAEITLKTFRVYF